MTSAASRGRPPASSRDTLQDAAFELFLENGYAGTTVEQITRRAGVSRNTFFNYFDSKSDVFWVELDEALAGLEATLRNAPAGERAVRSALAAILGIGRAFGPATVPFALTQYHLIGSVHELQASALTRFTRQAGLLAEFLGRSGFASLEARAAAYSLLAAAIAGAQSWAGAGTARGELEPYLLAALEPVVHGIESRQAGQPPAVAPADSDR
jgi:AcrR family transcriptional regulator